MNIQTTFGFSAGAGRWAVLLLAGFALACLTSHGVRLSDSLSLSKSELASLRLAMPISFEPHGSGFIARGAGYNLQLDAAQAVLFLPASREGHASADSLLKITPEKINPSPEAVAEDLLPGKSHYYIGDDPALWRTSVPQFGRVCYREVYDGIDLVYYGNEGKVEFDFIVAPGADPSRIAMRFDGAGGVRLDDAGDLVLDTPAGSLLQRRPVAYQEGAEGRVLIAADYRLSDGDRATFQLGAYDTTRPLIIDPILDYSSYIGGNEFDQIEGVSLDAAGNIYLSGQTASTSFPAGSQLTGGNPNSLDAFVLKLSPDARQVIYRTYVGGSSLEGFFVRNALKQDGSIVIGGRTNSSNFPTMNPLQATSGGGAWDMFVTQLNPQGQMQFSTYWGGEVSEDVGAVAVDQNGNIYIGGVTNSQAFPRMNAMQNTYGGGISDGFISKFGPNGSGVIYSTYLGGNSGDFISGIDTDAAGAVYAVGITESPNFPVTPGALRETPAGGEDAFVAKLNPAGSALVYSTRLGGSDFDAASAVAVDSQGNAYVAGDTASTNFPVMSIQNAKAGGDDTFLSKLNPAGTQLIYSTYLGGASDEFVGGMALNQYGEAYVIAGTQSADFPLRSAFQAQYRGGGDSVIFKVNAAGNALVYSSYLSGPAADGPLGIALDRVGGLVAMAGATAGGGFNTANPVQAANGGGLTDAYLALIVEAAGTSAASYARGELAPDSIGSVFGSDYATQTQAATATPLPNSLLNVSVTITDSQGADRACGLFFVSPGQINFVVPQATALGPAVVTVRTADGRLLRGAITIVAVAPGLFSANASGQGVAAANVLRVRNGVFTFEPLAQLQGGQFVPVPINMGPPTDEIYLVLYGTGMRGAGGATAAVGGTAVGVAGPVAQGEFVAVDQMNLGPLPRTLIGRGAVNITGLAGGKAFNTVSVTFQ